MLTPVQVLVRFTGQGSPKVGDSKSTESRTAPYTHTVIWRTLIDRFWASAT